MVLAAKDAKPETNFYAWRDKDGYRPLTDSEVEEFLHSYEIWHRIPDSEIMEAISKAVMPRLKPTFNGSPVKLIPGVGK